MNKGLLNREKKKPHNTRYVSDKKNEIQGSTTGQ